MVCPLRDTKTASDFRIFHIMLYYPPHLPPCFPGMSLATARAFALGEYSPKEGVDDRFKFQSMLDHYAFVAGETGGIKAIGKGFKKSEESRFEKSAKILSQLSTY